MSSPAEDEDGKIPADFIHCIQKLLSSVSTLSKHLSVLTSQKETTEEQNQELINKLQVRNKFSHYKDIIYISILI
jgi:chaperonin cofactor prefoldin